MLISKCLLMMRGRHWKLLPIFWGNPQFVPTQISGGGREPLGNLQISDTFQFVHFFNWLVSASPSRPHLPTFSPCHLSLALTRGGKIIGLCIVSNSWMGSGDKLDSRQGDWQCLFEVYLREEMKDNSLLVRKGFVSPNKKLWPSKENNQSDGRGKKAPVLFGDFLIWQGLIIGFRA